VIPYSRQTPIKKDKRMAGEAAQATTKAKEMHQKVNTARWVVALLLCTTNYSDSTY